MKYKSCTGRMAEVKTALHEITRFIPAPDLFLKQCSLSSAVHDKIKRYKVESLKGYLNRCITSGDCILVEISAHTLRKHRYKRKIVLVTPRVCALISVSEFIIYDIWDGPGFSRKRRM